MVIPGFACVTSSGVAPVPTYAAPGSGAAPTAGTVAAAGAGDGEKGDLVSMECFEDTDCCLLDTSLVMPHSSSPAVLYDPLMSHYMMQGAAEVPYWQNTSHGSGLGHGAFLN
jgi:hypothetical protein